MAWEPALQREVVDGSHWHLYLLLLSKIGSFVSKASHIKQQSYMVEVF